MPTPTKGPRLGGSPAHERIILGNLASQLFEHGRITTTEAKAKRVQPLAEKLITKAKRGDLHARRTVLKTVTDPSVVGHLFEELAPSFAGREGGYTRVTKVGNRKGDNAPMAVIELITDSVEQTRAAKPARTAVRASKPAAGPSAPAAQAAPAATEAEAVEVPQPAEDEAHSDDQAPGDEKVLETAAGSDPAEAQELEAEQGEQA